jgi:hypothetical protein
MDIMMLIIKLLVAKSHSRRFANQLICIAYASDSDSIRAVFATYGHWKRHTPARAALLPSGY